MAFAAAVASSSKDALPAHCQSGDWNLLEISAVTPDAFGRFQLIRRVSGLITSPDFPARCAELTVGRQRAVG